MTEPLPVRPPDDTGSATVARFKYQAHATFPFLFRLVREQDITAVFAEHIEDIAIQGAASWRFLQVKSRDIGLGPWTLANVVASGAIRSLWRAYRAVSKSVDATYEALLEGALSNEDVLAKFANGRTLDDAALARIAHDCGVGIDDIRDFAARLRFIELSPLTSIISDNLLFLAKAAPGLTMAEIEETYKTAVGEIEEAMVADRLGNWPAALFLGVDELSRLRLEKKRIDRARAERILAPVLGASRDRRAPFILPQIDVPTFTGRSEELDRLETILLRPGGAKVSSIVGVSGGGGIGKSALACHFAELHRDAFPGGVIGLRVDGRELTSIARDFAAHAYVEIDPGDERDASRIMQEVFRDRRALLIFDNAEEAAIRSLLPGGSVCAVIITTRDRGLPIVLGVPAEARLDLSPLPPDKAVELLAKLAGDRVKAGSDAAIRICTLVGNLPLAIQIAGATLQMPQWLWRSLDDYANELGEEKDRLALLHVRGDSTLDVRASFSLSLRLLEPAEVDFYAGLAVCAQDGFSAMAAGAANGCDERTASERITWLVRLSLVNFSAAGAARFVLHPLLRLFAREQAEARELLQTAETRHREFYAALVKAKTRDTEPAAASLLGCEIDDIVAAAESMSRNGIPDYDFVLRLEPFLQRHGHWQKAAAIFSAFLRSAESTNDWSSVAQLQLQQAKFLTLRGNFADAERTLRTVEDVIARIDTDTARERATAMWLNSLGVVLQRKGDFDVAADAFRRSEELLIAAGDLRGQAMVLTGLGVALQGQGNFGDAARALQRSASIEARLGNERGQAIVLNSLAGVLQRQGDFSAAADALAQSASIEAHLGNRHGQAMVLNSLGGVLQRQGKFGEAAEAFRQSHELLTQLNDARGQAMVLTSLGGVLQRQGDFAGAIEVLQQSAAIEARLGNERGQAIVLNSLGGVLQRQGKFDEAVEAFRKSHEISTRLEDERSVAMALNSLGGVLQRQGKFDEAVEAFRKSHEISARLKDERSVAMVLNSLGGVLQRQGKFDEAVEAFRKSHELLLRLGDERGQAMVLNSLGGVLQRQGEADEAVDVLRRSIAIGDDLGDLRHVAMVLNSLGGVLQRRGKFDDAVAAFRRSEEIRERLHDEYGLAMVLNSLGGVLQRQGKFDEAVEAFRKSHEIAARLKDERSVAMVLNSLGGALHRQRKTKEAFEAFRESIRIGEELGDQRHLAMVHTSFGRALLRTDRATAAEELRNGFEIDAALKNKKGIGIVAPLLIETLLKLDRRAEAADICERALRLIPNDERLLRLKRDLDR